MSAPSEAERLRVYQHIAERECQGKPVRVIMSDEVVRNSDGLRALGMAWWDGAGSYVIEVKRGLPLSEEARIFAHETGHVRYGHPPKIAPYFLRRMAEGLKAIPAPAAIAADAGRGEMRESLAELYASTTALSWRLSGVIPWA